MSAARRGAFRMAQAERRRLPDAVGRSFDPTRSVAHLEDWPCPAQCSTCVLGVWVTNAARHSYRYDETGRTDESAFADAEEMGWDAYFESLFERIDRRVLDEDKARYQGE